MSPCCSGACHPGKPEVACGFKSGSLRIFDAASAELVQESRQHVGAVVQLAYARHGRMLLSLGEPSRQTASHAAMYDSAPAPAKDSVWLLLYQPWLSCVRASYLPTCCRGGRVCVHL